MRISEKLNKILEKTIEFKDYLRTILKTSGFQRKIRSSCKL